MNPSVSSPAASFPPPGLWRRMFCFMYEGVLVFGVVMMAGLLFSPLTNQRNALEGRHGLGAFVFVVLGIYFVWFWSRSGQTVAMLAWHIRLVDRNGQRVSQWRGLLRYLLCWLWFMPAVVVIWASGLRGAWEMLGLLTTGVVVYALIARLHPSRQFMHDVICGTQLVTRRPPKKVKPSR